MTREEAIKQLKKLKSIHNGSYGEAINFAIESLKVDLAYDFEFGEEEKMIETELKLHPCYCGGEMEIKKVAQNGGMDGTYYNWELTCKKCGLAMTSAADGFYGRKYKTFEEVVADWNRNRNRKKEKTIKADILDKYKAESEVEE